MRTQIDGILKSNLSRFNSEHLNTRQYLAVEQAIYECCTVAVSKFRDEQNKEAVKESIKLFPALIKGEIMLWLRKRSFIRAKKKADMLADIENRPFYVIRQSETSYVVQSTLVARTLRKRGVYRKDVNLVKLHEIADYVSTPIKHK